MKNKGRRRMHQSEMMRVSCNNMVQYFDFPINIMKYGIPEFP